MVEWKRGLCVHVVLMFKVHALLMEKCVSMMESLHKQFRIDCHSTYSLLYRSNILFDRISRYTKKMN